MDPFVARLFWAVLFGMALGGLVVLVGAGSRRRRHEQAARQVYLSSFHYVLSADSDRAIEMLTKVRVEAPGGAETWLALGALLRRRGEHGRAIRIHEKLIENQKLDPSVRLAAAYELGRDFRSAGMLARAAETLERVLTTEPTHREAIRELREIYEESGDWNRALETQRRFDTQGEADPAILAHLHAAQARALLAAGRLEEAAAAAEQALQAGGADAHLAQAEILLASSSWHEAIEAFSAALDLAPELLDSIQARLEAAFDAWGELAGFGTFLARRMGREPENPWLQLALARHLRRRGLVAEAAAALRNLLEQHPQLTEARRELGEILLQEGSTEEIRAQLQAALEDLQGPHRPFGCRRCGVDLMNFSFRCPRCFGWDTVVRPLPAVDEEEEKAADRRTGS